MSFDSLSSPTFRSDLFTPSSVLKGREQRTNVSSGSEDGYSFSEEAADVYQISRRHKSSCSLLQGPQQWQCDSIVSEKCAVHVTAY
jgi:hypothetical protein